MEVTANRLLNYSGHGGAKTELGGQKSKIISENRKNILREKLMPLWMMVGPNKSEKCGYFTGTDLFSFCVA